MKQALILLMATLMVLMTPAVHGTQHLSFANDTEVNITRAGCGESKRCVERPMDCDPAANSSCLFASVIATHPMPPDGSAVSVQLRGESSGYIAVGLTANSSTEGTTMLFICGQNNGTFFFRTMQRNNSDSTLTPTETRVREIRGDVWSMGVIRCEFTVSAVNATSLATSRSMHTTTLNVLVGTGNVTNGTPGAFHVVFETGRINLVEAGSTAGSGAVQPQAVVALLGLVAAILAQRF